MTTDLERLLAPADLIPARPLVRADRLVPASPLVAADPPLPAFRLVLSAAMASRSGEQ
jgi:hypothetical protein